MRIQPVISPILAVAVLVASGCGSGGSEDPAAASVGIRVEPPSALVEPNGTVAFKATVAGTAVTDVTWSVDCGSVTQTGLYTAPSSSGTCRVTATSVAAPVSGSALVSVGAGVAAGGWAATCAAEPEPTTNVVYACDCQPGADGNCVAGNDSNPGTKAQPFRTWGKIQSAWRALPAGGTVALCKGGRFSADTDGYTAWQNFKCSPSSPCTLRDYTPPWAVGAVPAPVIAQTASQNAVTLLGSSTQPLKGLRFLNLRFYRPDGGTTKGPIGIRAIDYVTDVEVCNCDIDGFDLGFYVGGPAVGGTTACTTSGWKIRGNRIANNCTDGMLAMLSNSDVDGNRFDNNGHALCGSYNLASQTGGTTHTLYLNPNGDCLVENVRLINNETRRNAMYQGYPQGSSWKIAGGSRNMVWENNFFDMTPAHPTMAGGAMYAGNVFSSAIGQVGFVIRRNRILGGRGRQIGISSAPSVLIENNAILVSTSDPDGDIIGAPHEQGTTQTTSAVVRNNTIYVGNSTGLTAIRVARTSAASGNIVTGNSVTFAGGGGTCFGVDATSKVTLMDNNQCSGAANYAMSTSGYSLAGWRSATGFDSSSITPAPTGLFVDAANGNFTPASGSPLIGAASTRTDCTVLGAANQSCSSPVAIGTGQWSATDPGVTRSPPPNIGAVQQ